MCSEMFESWRPSGLGERELAILKKLQHPHILPLLGSFSSHIASGRQEYVLVFPKRESVLSAFLRMRFGQTIPPKVVQQFATQLLSALEHMHFRGILHRDLKPANILMKWDSLSITAGLVMSGMPEKFRAQRVSEREASRWSIRWAATYISRSWV